MTPFIPFFLPALHTFYPSPLAGTPSGRCVPPLLPDVSLMPSLRSRLRRDGTRRTSHVPRDCTGQPDAPKSRSIVPENRRRHRFRFKTPPTEPAKEEKTGHMPQI